jgi:hypothetical protein
VDRLVQVPLSRLAMSGELGEHDGWQVVCDGKGLDIVSLE